MVLINLRNSVPSKCSVLFVSKPSTRPKLKALSFVLVANAHGFSADPLSEIARLNKPDDNGDSTKKWTEAAPADSPNIVT